MVDFHNYGPTLTEHEVTALVNEIKDRYIGLALMRITIEMNGDITIRSAINRYGVMGAPDDNLGNAKLLLQSIEG